MSESRDVVQVMEKMLEIIPASEIELIDDIKIYKDALWNQAPEAKRTKDCWIPITSIMNHHITSIDSHWKIQLAKLFNNQ
jgi:hypothetical protein|uniref:Uncharacterized protein n=1 Tax=viral metagenome TaxID=1070528 RepID=A0A6C0HDZ2_9ZZZZ